jgi:hypothetical protein
LAPYVDSIFAYLVKVAQPVDVSEEILKSSIGLIGDLATAGGAPLLAYVTNPSVTAIIQQGIQLGAQSGNLELQETAQYAQGVNFT